MSEKTDFVSELYLFISKAGASILAVFIGIMAKISHDIMLKKKHSWPEWIGIIGMSVFGGYMMGLYCKSHNLDGDLLIPLATLFSEKIFMYIAANWNKIMNVILNRKQ